MSKWYKIIGITSEMYEAWKDDFRKDVVHWEDNGYVHARIILNPIEAWKMNREIKKYNKTHDHKLYLKELLYEKAEAR